MLLNMLVLRAVGNGGADAVIALRHHRHTKPEARFKLLPFVSTRLLVATAEKGIIGENSLGRDDL